MAAADQPQTLSAFQLSYEGGSEMAKRDLSDRKLLKRAGVVAAVLVVAVVLQTTGANPAVSQSPELVAFPATSPVSLDTDAAAWGDASQIEIPLTAQQVVWPFGGTVPTLKAAALHSEGRIYIRLEWQDATRDDDVVSLDTFVDAAAVEFPATAATSVPALCMGQADGGVNIWQWRAGAAEGRPNSITELSENGYVDLPPSEDDLYFPARAAGNVVSHPHVIQDLVATGFGSLDAASDQELQGAATWDGERWSVVFARELTSGAEDKISLGEGASTDVAFAVWDGSEQERNGSKSISAFVSMQVVGEVVVSAGGATAADGSAKSSDGYDKFKLVVWVLSGLFVALIFWFTTFQSAESESSER
jgi:hypothetical protein